jgi:hypothetical protein
VRPETLDRNGILKEQMEIWAAAAERAIEVRSEFPQAQFYDLHFEDLVADPVAQVRKAYQHFGIDWSPQCDSALRQWNADNPQHKHGKHSHRGEPLAIGYQQIRERFAAYIDRFGVNTD